VDSGIRGVLSAAGLGHGGLLCCEVLHAVRGLSTSSPLPGSFDAYREYRQFAVDFIKARNSRIFESIEMIALLIIDMQVGLFEGDPPRDDADGVIRRINEIARVVRALGMVIFIQHEDDGVLARHTRLGNTADSRTNGYGFVGT